VITYVTQVINKNIKTQRPDSTTNGDESMPEKRAQDCEIEGTQVVKNVNIFGPETTNILIKISK
jgi:hypothetical protein